MPLQVPVEQAQAALQSYYNAATTITNYAQATVTAVPAIPDPPDWFVSMQNHLTTAQAHANNWLNTICPAVTATVPQQLIDFNTAFQTASQQILSIQQDIENQGGTPESAQRQQVGQLFGGVTQKLSDREQAINSVQNQIKAYYADVESDQNNFGGDMAAAADRFSSGQTWVQQLKAAIGENFLDSNVLGPCASIVQINMNISFKIQGIDADPTLITLIIAQAIVQNQFANQTATQKAVQDVLDTWATFNAKTNAVISDLNDAADNQYINILSECDLATAQTQWQQLSDFAANLLAGSGGGGDNPTDETETDENSEM